MDFGIPVVVSLIFRLVSSLRCLPRLNSRSFILVSSLHGFPVLAWRSFSLLAGSSGAANPPSRTLYPWSGSLDLHSATILASIASASSRVSPSARIACLMFSQPNPSMAS